VSYGLWRRGKSDTHDNAVIIGMYRRNAAISTCRPANTDACVLSDAQILGCVEKNIWALRELSRRKVGMRVAGLAFRPTETVYLMVPRGRVYDILWSKCFDEKVSRVVKTIVEEKHFPPAINYAVAARSLLDMSRMEVPKGHDRRAAVRKRFEREKMEWLSIVGKAWELQRVLIKTYDTYERNDPYLKELSAWERERVRVRSYVAVPIRTQGRVIAVALLTSNRSFAFREDRVNYYEKYGHALGATLAIADRTGALVRSGVSDGLMEFAGGYEQLTELRRRGQFFSELGKFWRTGGAHVGKAIRAEATE